MWFTSQYYIFLRTVTLFYKSGDDRDLINSIVVILYGSSSYLIENLYSWGVSADTCRYMWDIKNLIFSIIRKNRNTNAGLGCILEDGSRVENRIAGVLRGYTIWRLTLLFEYNVYLWCGFAQYFIHVGIKIYYGGSINLLEGGFGSTPLALSYVSTHVTHFPGSCRVTQMH